MSPEWLIAEGHMPGRPSLLQSTILIQGDKSPVKVVHEDDSGVIYESVAAGIKGSKAFPFNYRTVADA